MLFKLKEKKDILNQILESLKEIINFRNIKFIKVYNNKN